MADDETPPCKEHGRTLDELRHTVYGNGRPGLKERVTIMETKFETQNKMLWALIVLSFPPIIQLVVMLLGRAG